MEVGGELTPKPDFVLLEIMQNPDGKRVILIEQIQIVNASVFEVVLIHFQNFLRKLRALLEDLDLVVDHLDGDLRDGEEVLGEGKDLDVFVSVLE